MAGYHGWSMSNNAVTAYENGEKPRSKWRKSDIFAAIKEQGVVLKCTMKKLQSVPAEVLKKEALRYASWHHTGNRYNETVFYCLDVERLEILTDEMLDELVRQYRMEKEEKPLEEKWKCAFLEWSGSRKHPHATEIIEEGIVKGDWFYREDGTKKKTTANGFRFIEKIEREKEQ